MSSLRDRLSEAPAVRLICIAGEHVGYEEFVGTYWRDEIFFDVGKKTWYPLMGSGKMVLSGLASYMFGGAVAQNVSRVNAKAIDGDFKGEGTILGGVWVISGVEKAVLFEHQVFFLRYKFPHHPAPSPSQPPCQEKSWGDNVCASPAKMDALLAAVDRIKASIRSRGPPAPN